MTLENDPQSPWRLGITASKKSGGSVERNRLRRRIREFFRIHQEEIPAGWDFVLNTAPSLNRASHLELEQDLKAALRKLGGSARRGDKK